MAIGYAPTDSSSTRPGTRPFRGLEPPGDPASPPDRLRPAASGGHKGDPAASQADPRYGGEAGCGWAARRVRDGVPGDRWGAVPTRRASLRAAGLASFCSQAPSHPLHIPWGKLSDPWRRARLRVRANVFLKNIGGRNRQVRPHSSLPGVGSGPAGGRGARAGSGERPVGPGDGLGSTRPGLPSKRHQDCIRPVRRIKSTFVITN